MSRSSFARAVAIAVIAIFATPFALAGCDQLNKPLGHPSGSSSSGSTSTTSSDGGDPLGEGGLAPAPTITAQPGDIQI